MAMGVEYATKVTSSNRTDERLFFKAKDFQESREGSLQDLSPSPIKMWANYFLGILQGLKERGIPLKGINMEAVGVESVGKLLIDRYFNDLEKYF